MLLSEPGQTAYDLKFSFLGFPCRVHPGFFILPVLFSGGLIGPNIIPGVGVLIIVAVFFISILVHEIGHALAFRYYNVDSRVVLYWMGGLAIPGRGGMGSWSGGRTRSLKPNEQIVVSLAGPVAGLLLAGFFTLLAFAITFNPELKNYGFGFFWAGPFPLPDYVDPRYDYFGTLLQNSRELQLFIRSSIIINVILNLFNLLPVYPLDGGQIARQLFVKFDPWSGVQKSVILSMCVAVFIAVYAMQKKEIYLAIFFGYMAFNNYQLLSTGGNRRPW